MYVCMYKKALSERRPVNRSLFYADFNAYGELIIVFHTRELLLVIYVTPESIFLNEKLDLFLPFS